MNVIKTLYFNLLAFPLKTALKFPVLLYGSFKIQNIGEIELQCLPKFGMISIGRYIHSEKSRKNYWDNNGNVIVKGRLIINSGILFRNYGTCKFGESVNIGNNCYMYCQNKIEFGNYVRTAAEGFYMDTDGHFLLNGETSKVSRMTKPIRIGNCVWLGYSVKIKKGGSIPDYSVVSSFSIVDKNIMDEGSFCIFGGVPAKVVKRNMVPILNLHEESLLKGMYFKNENLSLSSCEIDYLTKENTNFF